MTNKQIEEKLQEIEDKSPHLFRQFKLKDHIYWEPIPDTNKLKWGIHPQFLGNLPIALKAEVSKLMNKLTKGGYTQDKAKATPEKQAEIPEAGEAEQSVEGQASEPEQE